MGSRRLLAKELVGRYTPPGGLLGEKTQSPAHEEGDPLELFFWWEPKGGILTALLPHEVELAKPEGRRPGHG